VVLVDTGLPGRIDGLSATVSAAGYRWPQVSDVLVTHGHIDHVGSLAVVVSSSGATVWAHADDAPTIEQGVPSSPMTGRNLVGKRGDCSG
jgi:glyoxylase-like metal-dependent hydrolase (beta-lactamase superfamily II)